MSLLKFAITILLIVTIAIQTFSKWIIVLSYEINKDYIAKNLCINRKSRSSCCKGKCFLQKKIAAEEDQQQPVGKLSFQKDIQLQLFLHKYLQPDFSISKFIIHHDFFHVNGKSQEFIAALFQPPQYTLNNFFS